MEALSRTKIPITVCRWIYLPELEEWHLVVASPWYDTKGPFKTSRAVTEALERAGIYKKRYPSGGSVSQALTTRWLRSRNRKLANREMALSTS
jgi:hypothetical protein